MTLPGKEKADYRRPLFRIGVVAEMVGGTAATLRLWEKKGLVSPARRGKNRCYSYRDLERLKEVKRLLGVERMNIAGVRAALDRKRCWDIRKCGPRKEACPVYTRRKASGKR